MRTIGSFCARWSQVKLLGMALSKNELALLTRFGANVRRLRIDAEWTQAELAKGLKLKPRTVQKFEAGKINVPLVTLHRIRLALRCRWEALLGKRESKS